MEIFQRISFFIILGLLFIGGSTLIESDFLHEFLRKDLLTVLLAFLAVNTTTSSVVMTKLREITDKNGVDFSASIRELKVALVEQVIFVGLSVILLIISSSQLLINIAHRAEFILDAFLCSIFIAAIQNLYDTGAAIFVLLHHENGSQ